MIEYFKMPRIWKFSGKNIYWRSADAHFLKKFPARNKILFSDSKLPRRIEKRRKDHQSKIIIYI